MWLKQAQRCVGFLPSLLFCFGDHTLVFSVVRLSVLSRVLVVEPGGFILSHLQSFQYALSIIIMVWLHCVLLWIEMTPKVLRLPSGGPKREAAWMNMRRAFGGIAGNRRLRVV
ncbi:hypothetical protein J3F83DRAFT_130102 [Trichoderma novae-zelandiae]